MKRKNGRITIGFAEFDGLCPKSEIETVIKAKDKIKDSISIDPWRMQSSLISKEEFKIVTSLIIESRAKKFYADYNNNESILLNIKSIKFSSLEQLWLHGNLICNIEALIELDAPKIKLLNVSINNIHCVISMRKCSFNQLKFISKPNIVIDTDLYEQKRIKENKIDKKLMAKYGEKSLLICRSIASFRREH